jgi:phage terminase large subunit-like protein
MRSRRNPEKAQHAVDFFERLLVHTKDPYARQPFVLAPFQRDIIEALFGEETFDKDSRVWVRRYNLAWLEMARKNGKSELMAGIALLLTGGDDEEGAEVYGVAKDTDQASLIFNVAKRMVELSPLLSRHFKLYPTNRRIVYPKTDSYYRVIAADAMGNLGQNPHGVLFDEVIAQPDGQLWDALKTGFGTRRQPMMVAATTAGDDPASFAKIEHDFSARVDADPKLAPRRFVFVRNGDAAADPGDEEDWKKSNPAFGLFLRPQILRDEYESAKNNPREMRAFNQYRRNIWQDGPSSAWGGIEAWPNGAGSVTPEKLAGEPVWVGMVATSTSDLTAIAILARNPEGKGYWCRWRWFLPEDTKDALLRRTDGLAEGWFGRWIELTEGNVVDVARHTEELRSLVKTYDVRDLIYDSSGAIGIVQPLWNELTDRMWPTFASNPSSSLVDWERLLAAGVGKDAEFFHGGDPVADWQVKHVRVKQSTTEVVRIDRRTSTENVCGIAAAELALRRALLAVPARRSAYSDEGLMTV